jgi:Holliday junction resolvasome RuvABC ATP-dependent DNA helicase subunit
MSESFSPLNRFFPSWKLEPFNEKEIKTYIEKKLKTVDLTIDDEAIRSITTRSEGHPYVLVSMCYIIFDSLTDNERVISEDVISRAYPKIYYELAKDFFSPMYHPLTPKAKSVLYKIAFNLKDLDFSFREACIWTEMERNIVSPYIQELLRKGILNKPERGQYQVFHKLFLDYVKNMERER